MGSQAYLKGISKHVSGIKVISPYKVSITLKTPEAYWLNIMAMPFTTAMEDRKVVGGYMKKYGKNVAVGLNAINKHPIGTGPYMLKKWIQGKEVILMKNPHYHLIKGQPYASQIKVTIGPSSQTQDLQLEKGLLNLAPVSSSQYLTIISNSKYKKLYYRTPQKYAAKLHLIFRYEPQYGSV